jgi:short-subunit dehydrogenase involved in D-alanine esterification of teichoic acids
MGTKQRFGLAIFLAIVVFVCRRFLCRYSFLGKRIVITGGSRGFGLAIARRLAREGAILALISRDSEELARAKNDLEERGAVVSTWRCDVTNDSAVQSVIKTIGDSLGGIDILINNAGEIVVGPLISMTHKDFENALNIHFWSPLFVTLAPTKSNHCHSNFISVTRNGFRNRNNWQCCRRWCGSSTGTRGKRFHFTR